MPYFTICPVTLTCVLQSTFFCTSCRIDLKVSCRNHYIFCDQNSLQMLRFQIWKNIIHALLNDSSSVVAKWMLVWCMWFVYINVYSYFNKLRFVFLSLCIELNGMKLMFTYFKWCNLTWVRLCYFLQCSLTVYVQHKLSS